MTYDYELILIKESSTKKNKQGDDIPTETRKSVLCGKKSVARNEFYSAARAGLKPEIVFNMHNYEYEGEKKVEFKNQIYKVIRTYAANFEEIELTCEKV